ncbi:MAG: selenium cofactor biosynthesis protein YqeC [Spirochaetia bacterium]|nr:selenium cofactor biosynthesis protein YqeC [Spirochaetia bacterium]
MNLINALNIQFSKPLTIAFVGAGGKSTTMYRLELEFAKIQKSVLVTTTTMIFHPKIKARPHNTFYTGSVNLLLENISPSQGTITVAGSEIISEGKKIKGFSLLEIQQIQDSGYFDIILVEADGARGKPIKAPAEYEPVIPIDTDIVAGIIGMDCIDTIINDQNVHRPETFTKITGSSMGEIIGTKVLNNLIKSPAGIFKGTSLKSRKIVIFNKSDTAYRITKAKEIVENISESLNIERVLITSMTGNDYESYHRHEVPRLVANEFAARPCVQGNDLPDPVMAVIETGVNQWNFFRQQQN